MMRLRIEAVTCGPAPADLGAVLGEGDIAHPMQAVLDLPVAAQRGGELGCCGCREDWGAAVEDPVKGEGSPTRDVSGSWGFARSAISTGA